MKEVWKKWLPIELSRNMYKACYAELTDIDGIEISLVFNDTENLLKIKFENSVLAYQNVDEGKRLKMIGYLSDNYAKKFYTEWTLFIVENSSYLKWFHDESMEIYKDEDICHYVFLTENDVVDILSVFEPCVTIEYKKGN